MIKHLIAAIVLLAAGMLQNTLLNSVPYARHLNILLVVFICVILLAPTRVSALYGIIIGLALGSFLFMPWFIYLLSAFIVWAVVKALYVYIFSSFSLVSNTILILVATLVYDLANHGFLLLLRVFDVTAVESPFLNWDYLTMLGWKCLANMLLMSVVFVVIARVSKLLNLSFITSKRTS